jgi:conjugative relaxase-like TrwC/TraI family protein
VLSIGKLVSADYYLDSVARSVEDYYAGYGEAPGVWFGAGAADLGLSGLVDGEVLLGVLDGRGPDGARLVSGKAAAAGRLPGFDLTLSAPKSVTLLFALGDERVAEVVRAAHDRAVTEALGYLEAEAARVRRGHNGLRVEPAGGLVAAGFRHRTSRAGDPQLHTHLLVANLGRGPDGRWSALDGRLFYSHGRTAGFLYQAALRAELTARLGVRWGPVRHGSAEVAGFSQAELRAFSQRRAEITAAMAERGTDSARGAQAATLHTRQAKSRSQRIDTGPLASVNAKDYQVAEPASLVEQWRARAAGLGLSEMTVAERTGPGRSPAPVELEALSERLLSPAGLTAQASSFDRRDVLRALAEAAPEGMSVGPAREMASVFLAAPGLVRLEHGPVTSKDSIRRGDGRVVAGPGEGRWTTPELLAVETMLLERASASAGAGMARADPGALGLALAERPGLSGEQTAMVTRLTTSGAGVEIVIGAAGTGKTFGLDAARAAWSASGIPVFGAATAARAASELTAGSGIEATTIARLLIDVDRPYPLGGLAPGGVLVVDEAAMVGTRTLARLVEVAERSGTKLVLVGDPRQLPEIDAGGAFGALADRLGASVMVENRRQTQRWERDALTALRDGRVADALTAYGSHGRIHLTPTAGAAMAAMVADWYQQRAGGEAPVMIAGRRSAIDRLNELARAVRVDAGEVTGPDLETADGRRYGLGDEVVGLRNDRRLGILNGQTGTVTAVDVEVGALTVAVTDRRHGTERSVVLPAAYVNEHLDHGYALTDYKAQGLTATRALTLGDDLMTAERGYVALSRGRLANDLYWVASDPAPDRHGPAPEHRPIEELTRALSTSGAKTLAIDALPDIRRLAATRTLAELEGERDTLASGLRRGLPRAVDDELDWRRRWLSQAAEQLDAARARRSALEDQLAEMTGRRHRQQRTVLDGRLAAESQAVDGWAQQVEDRQTALGSVQAAQAARAGWISAHLDDLDRHARLGQAITRRRHHLLAVATHQPPAWLSQTLGSLPDGQLNRLIWQQTAGELLDYRDRHHIDDPHHPLGADPGRRGLAQERRRLARIIENTDRSLGHQLPPDLARSLHHGHQQGHGIEF